MSSEMERALDEILSGVNELLAKAPAAAARIKPVRKPLAEDNPTAFLVLLSHVESIDDHPAKMLARKMMLSLLEQRAQPLGFAPVEFAHVTVSPIMHRALRRLQTLGARLIDCVGPDTIWDCSGLSAQSIQAALGRLAVLARLDQGIDKSLIALPRIPERLKVKGFRPAKISVLDPQKAGHAALVIDQDNSDAVAATIFWLEQSRFAPDWFLGRAMVSGQFASLLNPGSLE